MAKRRKTSKEANSDRRRTPSARQFEKLDRQLLELLNERAELYARAQAAGKGQRLEEILDALAGRNTGPLRKESVRAIFRELLSGCRGLKTAPSIAFLGPEFTYSHLAAIEYFGQTTELMPVATIAAVFEEVERGHADFGIVPVENSTDGRVVDALYCMATSAAKICGEIPLKIRHCLLGSGERNQIERVVSKRQPLSQCRNWLSQHLPDVQLEEVGSTAQAAAQAAQDTATAAIASEQAGTNHGLKVLARQIEDNPDNVTRFVVIGSESAPKTGNDKTSIVFEVQHEPGALADAMAIFKRQKLNLTWIESFPVPAQRGRYLFFVEFLGHQKDLRAKRALQSLEKKAVRLTVLGSYAQADPIG